MSLSDTDTIAAIATPLGEAALGVIRMSGPQAVTVGDRVFAAARKGFALRDAASHTVHYGWIMSGPHRVDEVMLTVLRAPRTSTCEDVIEITCHGGMLTTRLVLETVLEAGARSAEPGEFTRRAFLNGRIDLSQAEAVADLIHARTELALRAAQEQMRGVLSRRIEIIRADLIGVLAHVEAHIDFPDEDISPDTADVLLHRLDHAQAKIIELQKTAGEGRILRQGVRAVIVGRPNAGKSSLLNLLLGHDRAIVSPIAGTTRDTIEETANILGIPVVFIDTAGLRQSADAVEALGIQRSYLALEQAELILHIMDRCDPLAAEDARLLEETGGRHRLIVLNKADLPAACELPGALATEAVAISCSSGQGIDDLKTRIKDLVWRGEITPGGDHIAINARHFDALRRSGEALAIGRQALSEGVSLDLVALDLRIALNAVGEVVGKTSTEDLLDAIFSTFCLGK